MPDFRSYSLKAVVGDDGYAPGFETISAHGVICYTCAFESPNRRLNRIKSCGILAVSDGNTFLYRCTKRSRSFAVTGDGKFFLVDGKIVGLVKCLEMFSINKRMIDMLLNFKIL